MLKNSLVLITILFSLCGLHANVYYVGPTRTYTMPSQVKTLLADGDSVYIDGGLYINDAVKWANKNLKFIGLGDKLNPTILRYTGNIPNGKGIWVFEQPGTSDNAYIENITFDGAQVSDGNGGNGAGIRYQCVDLTINHCRFVNCQNGILEGGVYSGSNVTILNSEFANNGYSGTDNSLVGYEHNIYISANTDTLLVQNCYFHNPRGEANSLKTRAQRSYILYNYIDEAAGNGSYEINIAQGGLLVVMGNTIIQGTSGANHSIIGWDAITNPIEELYFINNTVINKFAGNNKFFYITPGAGITTFKVYNNIFGSVTGASNTMFAGNQPVVIDSANNLILPNYTAFDFVNPAANNYNLLATATSAINAGTAAGTTGTGYSLTPLYEFLADTLALIPRVISGSAIDIGAYEYTEPLGIETTFANTFSIYPNPCSNNATITFNGDKTPATIRVFDMVGHQVFEASIPNTTSNYMLNTTAFAKGIYCVQIQTTKGVVGRKIVVE